MKLLLGALDARLVLLLCTHVFWIFLQFLPHSAISAAELGRL